MSPFIDFFFALRRAGLKIGLFEWNSVMKALHEGIIEPALDLTQDVVLDRQVGDFLTGRLETALKAIGNPPLAMATGTPTMQVIGKAAPKTATAHLPVADVLWDTARLAQTKTNRDAAGARRILESLNVRLNDSQWDAWREAMEKRLALIWGPPGTGKSQTLRAILLGLLLEAHAAGRPIRILVTSNTYDATDNVVLRMFERILQLAIERREAARRDDARAKSHS